MLINASPDLAQQLGSYFNVSKSRIRASPFAEVFLTNADLDHSLGLLLLREGPHLQVTAPSGVCDTLARFLRFDDILNSACGVTWREPSAEWQPSALPELQYRAIPIPHAVAPRFAPHCIGHHGVGYLVRHGAAGKVAGFFPDVGELNDSMLGVLGECHTVFFDGTFWTDDELVQPGISQRTAKQMGHIPVNESTKKLAPLIANGTHIFFLHINNTNPILNPRSRERLEIETVGLRVAEDGMRLIL